MPIQTEVQAWLHCRAKLAPRLLIQAPPWIRGVFDHAWAPMQALARQLDLLPVDVWEHLLNCPAGYVLICGSDSQYIPGPVTMAAQPFIAARRPDGYASGPTGVRSEELVNVAFVSVTDLAANNEQPLHVVGHLIDHHLGSAGDPAGLWLSEGGGVKARWRESAARISRLFALGYGVDSVARSGVRDYFAQSLALYCREREPLTIADPQICKWFRATLWNRAFWA